MKEKHVKYFLMSFLIQWVCKKFLEVGKPKKPNDEIYVGKWDEARHLEWAKPRNVVKKGVLNKIKVTSKNVN